MTTVQEIALPLLLVWTIMETVWDFRAREIPRWFSLIPLGSGLACWFVTGAGVPAVLVAFSIAVTNIQSARWQVPAVLLPAVVISFLFLDMLPVLVVWVSVYLLWRLAYLGGADALAAAYLVIWYPSWEMAIAIFAGMILWAVLALIVRYGRQAGARVWVVAKTGAHGTKAPLLGAFPLALAIYILLGYLYNGV